MPTMASGEFGKKEKIRSDKKLEERGLWYLASWRRVRVPDLISDEDLLRSPMRPLTEKDSTPVRGAMEYLEYGKDNYWSGDKMVDHTLKTTLPILRYAFLGCRDLWAFDNAINHNSCASDALIAHCFMCQSQPRWLSAGNTWGLELSSWSKASSLYGISTKLLWYSITRSPKGYRGYSPRARSLPNGVVVGLMAIACPTYGRLWGHRVEKQCHSGCTALFSWSIAGRTWMCPSGDNI